MIAQVLADHTGDFVGICHNPVQGAVLRQPFDGGLRAALLHAGDTIDGIADQCQIVDDAFRADAELGLDAVLVEQFVAHCVVPAHMRADQLGQVLVAGRNQRVDAVDRSFRCQRADHVVGLDAIDHDHRPAGSLDRGMNRFDLGAQIFGHRRAVRLVFGIPVIAESFSLGVEDHGLVVCLVVAFQPA